VAIIVNTGLIQVNEFRINAAMNQGMSTGDSWTDSSKTNYGMGQIPGNVNLVPIGANIVIDTDFIDTIIGGEIKPPLGSGNVQLT